MIVKGGLETTTCEDVPGCTGCTSQSLLFLGDFPGLAAVQE